jgi:uncharacterized membrane protein HdeD (DUF308 family)
MILLGSIALGDTLMVTLVSVLLIGWLLIGAGILHIVHLIRRAETRSFWHILSAIIDLLAGFYLVIHPALGAITLTLVLSAFFFATGITRLVAALQMNEPHKLWPVFDSLISILLGVMLWIHWPWTGFWFIGFAVVIGLVFRGWTWVMIALALRARESRSALSTQPA